MQFVRKLPDVNEIKEEYSLTPDQQKKRGERIQEICNVLDGNDSRKLLCIGPCSADREDAVVDYMLRLAHLEERVRDKFVIIPRIYTSKPRTKGTGYKGLLHSQPLSHKSDDLWEGVIAVRKMHLHVIQATGLFGADEMLYPEMLYYILDLLSYVAVGARSVEDQGHRLTASGINVPVGMKNPTNGDMITQINSIIAAQSAQSMIYRGWEVKTEGNPYAHAILRGFTDLAGEVHPNYHYEDLCKLHDLYAKENLQGMSVVVDCNHGNSAKRYDHQPRIAKEVIQSCRLDSNLNSFVRGLMIESYIEDGAQMVGQEIYGKSITDACLGWDKTERLILELAEMV